MEGLKRTGLKYANAWIGGNDIEEEGVWKWTDCTPWEVTFWASKEPSNAGDEDCVNHVFNSPGYPHFNHKWNDVNCDRETGFLCSKKICKGKSYQNDFLSVPGVVMLVFDGSVFGFGG